MMNVGAELFTLDPFNRGFVRFPRSMEEFPWANDPPTLAVYIHLCLAAKWKESSFAGTTLGAGQVLTSLSDICRRSGATERQARTALTRLQASGYATVISSNKHRIITLVGQGVVDAADLQASSRTTSKASSTSTGKRQAKRGGATTYVEGTQKNEESKKEEVEEKIEREDMETPNGVSGFAQPPEEVFVDEPPPEDEGPPDPPDFAQPPQNGDKRHPGVTAVIDYLTAQLKEKGLAEGLDGTKQDNRNFAMHLLNRLKKEFPDFNEVESAKVMVDFALADPFHSRNAVRVKYLWNNVSKFKAEIEANKRNPKTQSDDDRKQALASEFEKLFARRAAAGTGTV